MDFLVRASIGIGIVAGHRHRKGSIMTNFILEVVLNEGVILLGRRNIDRRGGMLFWKGMQHRRDVFCWRRNVHRRRGRIHLGFTAVQWTTWRVVHQGQGGKGFGWLMTFNVWRRALFKAVHLIDGW